MFSASVRFLFTTVSILPIALCMMAACCQLYAVDGVNTWNNLGGNGLWNTSGNWSQNEIPNSNDVATFDGTSTAACAMNATVNVKGIMGAPPLV